ncbi:MAG: translation elongation factor-like protein [Nanoarchaeota archaeon]
MEKEVGTVKHFFDKVQVAVIELSGTLSVGDKIHVVGSTTNFEQKIKSMQIEHKAITKAKNKDSIGLKVDDKVRPNDKVYLVK